MSNLDVKGGEIPLSDVEYKRVDTSATVKYLTELAAGRDVL